MGRPVRYNGSIRKKGGAAVNRISMSRRTQALVLIFLCFLWTSAGYLSWLYRLMDAYGDQRADVAAEVIGYLFQALGLLVFSLAVKRREGLAGTRPFAAAICADCLCMLAALLLPGRAAMLGFGFGMNLLHGLLAGFYLYRLTLATEWNRRALTFGLGYALATGCAWLLSLLGHGSFLRSRAVLPVYLLLALLTGLLLPLERRAAPEPRSDGPAPAPGLIVLAACAVTLLSLVKGLGFAFPSADIRQGIDLELSRVFYAFGLLAAGLISDKERKYGAICCVASLGVPFLMIALSDRLGPSILFWIIGYLLYGFFTVFRVVLFCDLARKRRPLLWLCGFGLLFGRVGDAAGAFVRIWLGERLTALVIVAAGAFTVAVVCFFMLYHRLYVPAVLPVRSEQEFFDSFAARCDLSSREREVLRLILDGMSTQEIAGELFVTESTVKYHIHNLLKKTGCANRVALVAQYQASKQPPAAYAAQ